MKRSSMVPWLLLAIIPSLSRAADVTGMFSTLHFNEESGDYAGVELHIVRGGQGYAIVIQASEGALGLPEVFIPRVSGNIVTFAIPPESMTGLEPAEYRAAIGDTELLLEGPRGPRKVPRRQSHWR